MQFPQYESPLKREGLSPKQQVIYGKLMIINSYISNIDRYLEGGDIDLAIHSYHLMLDIYDGLLKMPIPFEGKEILHSKMERNRKKIKEALGSSSDF